MQLKTGRFILVVAIVAVLFQGAHAEPVRVMSFNIRYGTAPDGDNAWPHRKEFVAKVIEQQNPDLLGLQEALRDQVDFLVDASGEYERIGVGREADGSGEYSAILYRRSRFDVSDAGTFWLSDTPETPGSMTWGNTLPRICSWVRLLDRTNGRRFLMLNTHWDHQSQPARLASGELMARRIGELSAAGEPVIVTGDYNAAPDNPAFQALLEQAELRDTFQQLHPDETDVSTFNGFGLTPHPFKIDAVLVTKEWQVREAEIVRTRDGKRYPSDHFPINAVVELAEPTTNAN